MYMKHSIFVCSLAVAFSAAVYPSGNVCAQKLPVRQAAKAAAEKAVSVPRLPAVRGLKGSFSVPSVPAAGARVPKVPGQPVLSSVDALKPALQKVDQTALEAAKQAAQKAKQEAGKISAAPDMRLSIAKVQSALLAELPESQQPVATAFIFKTTYNGKEEVWGATAAHIAKGMGKKLTLIFYNGDTKIIVPAEVVQYGPNMISDLALLKLPEKLPAEIVPLPLAQIPSTRGEAFISGGYSGHHFVYTGKQHLQKDNSRFLRTDFSVPLKHRAGLCGAPLLNAQGEVTGIHCGSVWGGDIAYAANTGVLDYLLKAQHEGSADIPLVAGPLRLGFLKTTEHIHSVEALNARQQTIGRYDTENRLTQSTMLALLNQPEVRFLRFMLEDRGAKPVEFSMNNPFRYLIYDKEEKSFYYQDIHW